MPKAKVTLNKPAETKDRHKALAENEALGAKTDYAKDLLRGFKQAISMLSITSELAGDIDGLGLSSTVDVDESPGKINDEPPGAANELPGAANELPGAADELPGATNESPGTTAANKLLPRTRKVLGEKSKENLLKNFLPGIYLTIVFFILII
ncbi:hypothetical protein C2G38_2320732 [Gigaspora rosea]|uniref:Uncharacterized protein n=1 Tax=Gigaspora rosea TaxID=44941 RepID=A0A397UZ50_9GLOM|nr:hypothetical protein C2G38_2320732 [Gigaspora rosea]